MSLSRLPVSNDPARILAHCPASACGLPITVLPIPAEAQASNTANAAARLYVAQQGRGRRWYRRAGRTRLLHTAPRVTDLMRRRLGITPRVLRRRA